jgi:hypothetical protein
MIIGRGVGQQLLIKNMRYKWKVDVWAFIFIE